MTISPRPQEDKQQHHQQRVELGLAGDIVAIIGGMIGVSVSWRVWMPGDLVVNIWQRLCKNEVRMCMKMAGIC